MRSDFRMWLQGGGGEKVGMGWGEGIGLWDRGIGGEN